MFSQSHQSHRIRLLYLIAISFLLVACGGGGGSSDGGTDTDKVSPPTSIFGGWVNTGISDQPFISWAEVDEAAEFNIYKTTSLTNTIKINSSPLPYSGYYPLDNEEAQYYVTAVDTNGKESTPSDMVRVVPSLTNHDDMTGISPYNGETDVPTIPTFSWDAYPGTSHYVVWVISSGGIVWGIRVPGTTTSITYGSTNGDMIIPPTENPLLPDTEYYLYIMAINSDNWTIANNRGAGGDVEKFTTTN